MFFKRKHKSEKEMCKIRDIASRFLPNGTKVMITGYKLNDERCLGRIGVINGFSYGATKVNVLFKLDDNEWFEELVNMEDALDVLVVQKPK